MAARDIHVLAAICVGGALGSTARYGLESWNPRGHGFPTTTLAINLSGALLLGILVGAIAVRAASRGGQWHPLTRPFLGTGLLGGYTTFSTFAVETRELSALSGATYVILSVAGGVGLALAGLAIGERSAGPGRGSPALPLDPDL